MLTIHCLLHRISLRMKLKNQSKKPRKCKRRQKILSRNNFVKNYRVHRKETAETKTPKPETKPQDASSKTKNTEEKTNSDRKAHKMVSRSRSRIKSEKLKNYFTEQDGNLVIRFCKYLLISGVHFPSFR